MVGPGFGDYCIVGDPPARRTFSRIWSVGAVQVERLGVPIVSCEAALHRVDEVRGGVGDPLADRFVGQAREKTSTTFSDELEFGVKCSWNPDGTRIVLDRSGQPF
jgi:hypothetical protein